jgi:hypothetical protein
VQVTLRVIGNRLQALVYRGDTKQYLNPSGDWQSNYTIALDTTDNAITGMGLTGIARPAGYTGVVYSDDFDAVASTGDNQPPAVGIVQPAPGATLTGIATFQANVQDAGGLDHVEFLVDGVLRYSSSTAPYTWTVDTSGMSNGTHTLLVRAYDLAGNEGQATVNFTVQNQSITLPSIPQHYPNIRIAELAYTGTPFTSVEQQLLKNSVDLVIPNPQYLAQINSVAPTTPQMIYTNVSNLYQQSLVDWLNYANAHKYSPEDAFYHVTIPTPFTGASASSQPVNWFWYVGRGSSLTALTDLTTAAHDSTVGDVRFGSAGQSLYIGYLDPFRELNFNLSQVAASGWKGVLEYASAVDANGIPTAWKQLTMLNDGTSGFTKSGQITFDPPADWSMSQVGPVGRLFYVRIRTTVDGTAPAATTILGRDYVNANGASQGTIPAFDYAADKNHDGYLNDAEYAQRAPGKDARFAYESRLFYPYYGQMRFVTNPSSTHVQQWAADYDARLLASQPLADGLFLDNSGGVLPIAGYSVLEPTAAYSADYGTMLGAISRHIAPKWLVANTSGGGAPTDVVIQNTAASLEESALRPLASSWSQFEDMANMIAHRQSLTSPAHYMVLDTLTTGGSPTDPRTQIATLAYYYLVGDPNTTFLLYNGGAEPSTSWTRHWIPAAAYNIGLPVSSWSILTTGKDPANTALTYHVYQRSYTNALVLYKPLSYTSGVGTGTLADNTATTIQLNGRYRLLNSDGTLGTVITSVNLRNGEGAILVKAS